ncbi:DNA polymerase III subunit delta [Saccharophagus degradans]|uniref:DNA polymerase III subunit delta n=1 Tax=Saccharophagus degradans TaxID=86304 RepID=A0AAW7XDE7_9GAMM|nr:DNA polymerase III subunit delta [Saccharophagus degradans]MBU2985245.1 DNA polymerase III subunit delta [Saccharophagus degradans]MDO6424437.1 DNA polymerase III subunit delta [Saccharophagus degradans]MDO6608356.1 DNA polymerase III subunit delta [Saccharophagus degradans]
MARINADQLASHIKNALPPVILITGDEALVVQESCDAVRAAARKQGFTERELHHTDAGFSWDQLLQSANSLSLFSEKKIIEIRVTNGKPGDAGSKALVELCQNPSADTLILLVFPKIDKRAQNSKWFKALEAIGCIVTVWPVGMPQLPRWIDQRLKAAGLRADSAAIDILAAKVEGNLLAAAQEIEKLKLVATNELIDSQLMTSAVMESARYDVFGLLDKALLGDAQAASRTLLGLKGEGTEPTVILWALTREARILASIKEATDAGEHFGQAAKRNGVWDKRQRLVQQALSQQSAKKLHMLLRKCALADRTIKGMSRGDAWAILLDITLSLAGVDSFTPRTQRAMIR